MNRPKDADRTRHNLSLRQVAPMLAVVMAATLSACEEPLYPEPDSAIAGPRGPASAVATPNLYASTNQGELVLVDVDAGTATLIGDAGSWAGRSPGWTGLSFDPQGNLYTSSRNQTELPTDGCSGWYGNPGCSHLYLVDPGDGSILAEIGSTQSAWISDIDFASDGTLYANDYYNTVSRGDGGLVTLGPTDATRIPIGRYDAADAHRELEYGGLTVTSSGDIWAVESDWAYTPPRYLFEVDPTTGSAIDAFTLVQAGIPIGFGFGGLEALPDGRLIGARSRGFLELYEIVPDATLGVAEVTLLPVTWPTLAGSVNGLEAEPRDVEPGDLLSLVQELVDSGHLAANKSKSLIAKVNAAEALIGMDNLDAAVNVLGALLNQLDALVSSGDVTEEQVASLRADTVELIEQLTG